jgi:hypothetical protein
MRTHIDLFCSFLFFNRPRHINYQTVHGDPINLMRAPTTDRPHRASFKTPRRSPLRSLPLCRCRTKKLKLRRRKNPFGANRGAPWSNPTNAAWALGRARRVVLMRIGEM